MALALYADAWAAVRPIFALLLTCLLGWGVLLIFSTGSSSVLPSGPVVLHLIHGIAAVGGKIHVLGGEGWIDDFGGVFRAHEVYDPETNSWSRAARMITPRHGFAVGLVEKTIYAVSGVNNAGGGGTLSVVSVNEIFEE